MPAMSRNAPAIDLTAFRADQRAALDDEAAGPHEVRGDDEQDAYDEHAERARRLKILQRAEREFDPVPFDAEAARLFGRVTATAVAAGRKPRRRVADLMIAATAMAEGLPLFTSNPDDFAGLDSSSSSYRLPAPVPHERDSTDCARS
jgi:predicted nucleic acid-binding protein